MMGREGKDARARFACQARRDVREQGADRRVVLEFIERGIHQAFGGDEPLPFRSVDAKFKLSTNYGKDRPR